MTWQDRQPGSKNARRKRQASWRPCCWYCETSMPGRPRRPRCTEKKAVIDEQLSDLQDILDEWNFMMEDMFDV